MKWTLEAVNERLKAGKVGVTIRQRGDRLSLRATLPPKPNSEKQIWHQQDISLRIYANPAGFQRAEAEAKLLGGRIASGQFSWSFYLDVVDEPISSTSTEAWVKKFEEDYFARRGRSPTTKQTWEVIYLPTWKLLGEELTSTSLIAAACQKEADTRTRKMVCQNLAALAKFAGIAVDLAPYAGKYKFANIADRQIPSTQEIEAARSCLNGKPSWQWIFGMLATYGLRPHEVFFSEISPNPPYVLKVNKGKTGSREVYPYHLRWVEMWQLQEQRKPPCEYQTFRRYGRYVTRIFSRHNLPFTSYCLRHAFCIRLSSEYKIPVAIAASWTGHDPAIFLRTYNRWISGDEKRRVFEESQIHFR